MTTQNKTSLIDGLTAASEKATYQYTDEAGNVLFTKERYVKADGSKGYAYSHVLNGEVIKKMPTFEHGTPLYNLQRLAKHSTLPVYLVEGEKCVDALTKFKLLATTTGGASSDDKAYLLPLAGREIIAWADNDEAGLGYISRLKQKLMSLGATVKEIDIDALRLPIKGDCFDWLNMFEAEHGRHATKADVDALPLKTAGIETPASDYLPVVDVKVLPQSDDDFIKQLAALKPLEYDRVRAEKAKTLKVQVKTLDGMVKAEREANNQTDSPFADIEPWHEPVNLAQVLDEITSTTQRFIVLDKYQAQAAALWVAACWFIEVIDCAPIALINAPERACGKTQFLTVLARLAPRSVQASGISPSVLFRMIEAFQPTLFIDEIETVLKDNEELRGLINAGHTRDSAYVWRSVAKGDDFEPKRFTVWGMKAIAGINAIKLAETVTSRSIVFELRRKTANESVERLRRAEAGLFATLASKLARCKDDFASSVQQARPVLPDALGDREQDNFEPLLQIAMVAGGHWPVTGLNLALRLSNATQTPISNANELLTDIQEVLENKGLTRVHTTELINGLCEDAEKSWATYNYGKQLTPRQLSKMLKPYGIESKNIRIGYDNKKGFEVEQFKDAFTRYLTDPQNLKSQGNILPEANRHGLFSVTDDVAVTNNKRNNCDDVTNSETMGNRKVTLEPAPILGCDGVTDKTPILEGVARANHDNQIARF